MYKKKLQNETTCMRPLHLSLLTPAALCSPHFLSCTNTTHLPYWIPLPSASFIGRPRHSLPSISMPASHLSVICSSFAVCITTIKFAVLAWRLYHEYTRKPKPKLKIWLDAGMSAIFAILSWLLLAFSLTRPEHGLQIVLSLAEGSTIVYQVGCLTLLRNFC
jgi:amino acid permease